MEILLLNVASLALEGSIPRVSVDQHITCDDTHRSTVGQAVEQSSLSSARNTHQRCQGTRLDPTINVIQNLPRLFLDLNLVADVSPVKHASLLLDETGTFLVGITLFTGASGNNWTTNSLANLSVVLVVTPDGRLVTQAEQQDFALGLLLRNQLGGNHVGEEEEQDESNQDANVAPFVGDVVRERRVDVVVAGNEILASNRTDS